jgi:hypothetical protein
MVEQAIAERGNDRRVAEQLPAGRFDVMSVAARSYRRMTISRRSPAPVCGSFGIARSPMISRGS